MQHALLVVADISGYTRYLGGVELEHSHDVLADLLGVVAERLGQTFEVVKLEGDAVFCKGSDPRPLSTLRACYRAFALRKQTIVLNTTCPCDACREISALDLKFVAHHGEFVEHEVVGRTELVGPDVIVVHRMLKNDVGERFGLSGYAFLSERFTAAAQLDTEGLARHVQRYADIGEVAGVVLDLRDSASERASGAGAGSSQSAAAQITREATLSGPPEVVWAALTDAASQMRWRAGVTSVESDRPPGVGARTHCVHGRVKIAQEIVAWDPPRSYAYIERNPLGECLWTIELEPATAAATHMTWRIALTGGRRQRVLYRLLGARMRAAVDGSLAGLIAFLGAADG